MLTQWESLRVMISLQMILVAWSVVDESIRRASMFDDVDEAGNVVAWSELYVFTAYLAKLK